MDERIAPPNVIRGASAVPSGAEPGGGYNGGDHVGLAMAAPEGLVFGRLPGSHGGRGAITWGPRLRRAISSATMLIAISMTDCEPISRPTGAATAQVGLSDPLVAQALEDEPDLPPAADQADVGGGRRGKAMKGFLVVAVPPGYDQGISPGVISSRCRTSSIGPTSDPLGRREPLELAY